MVDNVAQSKFVTHKAPLALGIRSLRRHLGTLILSIGAEMQCWLPVSYLLRLDVDLIWARTSDMLTQLKAFDLAEAEFRGCNRYSAVDKEGGRGEREGARGEKQGTAPHV